MSSRLTQLTARRRVLQARCELQREEVRLVYGSIERTAGRADRMIETARSIGPMIAVGGIVVLLALGPGRALRALRRVFTVALYANQTLRMMR